MDPDAELVVVVVVTYNSAPLLADLVASLGPGFGDLAWHLVVADNASGDDSAATARALVPEATVLDVGSNRGYAAGINAAIEAVPAHTAVLVLNPDVRLEPGCVPELVATLRSTGAGIVVPRLEDKDGDLILSMRREPSVLRTLGDALIGTTFAGRFSLLGEMVTDPRAYESGAETDWAEGSTQLVSTDCWDACGPWDESYFLYSEETDFNLRARDAGYDIRYVPTARAVHLEGGSSTSARLWPLVVANRVRLFQRRNGWVRAVPFWAAVVLREGSRALLGRQTSRAALAVLMSPTRLRAERGPQWLKD